MKKLLVLLMILLTSGCAQLNLGSNVTNVQVIKIIISGEDTENKMEGSKLEDFNPDQKSKGTVDPTGLVP